ncbi:GNAT family N-acetyltransferase [Alphaproteobacteria bacterium KMM 3653]|uniref:GNAT family N-acetyltransferase n=1 Tax=Harenicola maris TaxID=2841044 RepID=A0AAP2CVW5_9RHOB|nr:GNAT family N-acetyltransferase [Harenicola maris]
MTEEIIISKGDPRSPGARALLETSHALMQSLFPPEDNFYLDIDDLCTPSIHFFTGTQGTETLGCAALAVKDGYGEVKSMFVTSAARGTGLGGRLLEQVEQEARNQGLPLLRLETGNLLKEAHRLYHRHGFTECGPFGDYPDAGSSIFMEKPLT